MRFRIDQHVAAPVRAVAEALLDPAYLAELARLPKLGAPQLLDQRTDGTTIERAIRYRFTGEVNAAVRRVVDPSRLTWVEESTTDRETHTTRWRIRPDHYAHLIRGEGGFRLEPDDGGTCRVAEGEIRVSVPLVGSKVERAIVSGLEEHAATETPVLERWISEQGHSSS